MGTVNTSLVGRKSRAMGSAKVMTHVAMLACRPSTVIFFSIEFSSPMSAFGLVHDCYQPLGEATLPQSVQAGRDLVKSNLLNARNELALGDHLKELLDVLAVSAAAAYEGPAVVD